jgi:DNA-binding transcriptional MerR regulator
MLRTAKDLSEALSIPAHRTRYLISRLHLQPVQRAGTTRLFTDDALTALKRVLTARRSLGEAISGPTPMNIAAGAERTT